MAYLEISKGKALLQSPLDKDAMSIGRLPGNSIVINDPDISRRHCVIERDGGAYNIYDLGSRNGTLVNGQRVQRTELQPGDVITLGGTIARFLDAPSRKSPAAPAAEEAAASITEPSAVVKPAPRARRRTAWLIWLPSLTIFLLAVFIVAWAMGLLGGQFTVADLRQRLGLTSGPQVISAPGVINSGGAAPATMPTNGAGEEPARSTSPSEDQSSTAPIIEPDTAVARYRLITRETELPALERLLGQFVSARFVGKPLRDDRDRLIWELPPDGTIIALFEPSGAGASTVMRTLDAEPLLIEANLCGRLARDPTNGRLLLRVGVIDVLHAWGGTDETLRPDTLQLLNKRIVMNPNNQAGAGAGADDGI